MQSFGDRHIPRLDDVPGVRLRGGLSDQEQVVDLLIDEVAVALEVVLVDVQRRRGTEVDSRRPSCRPGSATYGSTEVTSSVTYTDPDADDEVLAHTVGRPDPELDLRLLTHDGRWGRAG